jgi:cellulose synthase/poly-beta-1,6-N-acetylglucosamine synthase-like glycosyltransferase
VDCVFRVPDESEFMSQGRRLSLANIFKGGAHLVRRMPSLALVTAISALLEPFLPDRSTFDRTLDRSAWDSLIGMFEISNLHLTTLGAALVLFQALLACWFTNGAFEIEEARALSTGAFLHFVARFLWTTVLLYAAFGTAAFLFAFLLSGLIFPLSPIAEKVIFLGTGAVIFPASTMLHAFSVYWVYAKSSLLDAYRAVASSVMAYGLKGYAFFVFTIGIRLAGVAAWYAVLSSPIYYPVRLVLAAVILAMVTMFLRGIRFEFQYLHEVNRDPDRQGWIARRRNG